jgi:pimeloyl-ACP methyl ester carboxylesterase
MDLVYDSSIKLGPLIIFCHGYKGFKDWGAWPLLSEALAASGFVVIKFNFSHNGGTHKQPIDFPDLEAFGNNNYTKELEDLDRVISWVQITYANHPNMNPLNLTLIGHSRGGGIVTIKAAEDPRVKKVISLAGVSDFKSRFPLGKELEKWKETGVRFVENGRTKQLMPHYYQFYKDFIANEPRLTIQTAVKKLKIPFLIIHGDADTSVSINEALALRGWSPNGQFIALQGANHVFGSSHPWVLTELPPYFDQIHTEITHFINN